MQTAARHGMHGCNAHAKLMTCQTLGVCLFCLNVVKCKCLLAIAERQKPAHSVCVVVSRACSNDEQRL